MVVVVLSVEEVCITVTTITTIIIIVGMLKLMTGEAVDVERSPRRNTGVDSEHSKVDPEAVKEREAGLTRPGPLTQTPSFQRQGRH